LGRCSTAGADEFRYGLLKSCGARPMRAPRRKPGPKPWKRVPVELPRLGSGMH